MKKIILSAVAIFAFGVASAQLREKGTIEIISQIGASTSIYNGGDANRIDYNYSSLSGFSFGVGADYFFNDRWSMRSGLLYQPMGSKINSVKVTEKIDYLTLPVNANWHFGSTRKWNLNFGPSFGFLLSADGNGIDLKDRANEIQVGFNYGIGYKIEITNQISILIDFQGMTGLSDIAKDADTTIKNSYSSFNVGGVFKL